MNKIDIILYINLERRTDRNERMICELDIFKNQTIEIKRVNACATSYDGAVGCTLSHIFALKHALMNEKNNNILILEDDFSFIRSGSEINIALEKLFERKYDWKCVLLSYGPETKSRQYDELLNVISMATMTSGYLIKRSIVQDLINLYQDSLKPLIQTRNHLKYAADRCWEKMMERNNWFVFNNRLGVQCLSFSDIGKFDRSCLSNQDELSFKTYVIHNGDHSILILRDIFARHGITYREATDNTEYTEEYRVVIIVGENYSKKDFPKSFVIEDPSIYPTLTFTELLCQSGFMRTTCYVKIHGKICDKLFQIAAAFSYSKKYYKNLVIIQENTQEEILLETILGKYKEFLYKDVTLPNNIYNHIEIEDSIPPYVLNDILLNGLFQSSKYIYDDIDFNFQFIKKTTLQHVIVFTDEKEHPNVDYYTTARKIIYEKIENPIFILVGEEALDIFKDDDFTQFDGNVAEILQLTASVYNIIMSDSTLSWWGTYFASKNKEEVNVVITPRKWNSTNDKWITIN